MQPNNNVTVCSIRKSYLLYSASVYLLLPVLLFLLGWVRVYVSVPLCGLLVLSVYVACRRTISGWKEKLCIFNRRDTFGLFVSILVLLIFTDLIGLHGHVQQSEDFLVRNPIYETLIREPWPIYSERGEWFVYYHAFWLPPALLCKLFHCSSVSDTVLFVWVYVGVMLATMVLFTRLKKYILLFTVVLIVSGNLSEILKGVNVIAMQWHGASPWLAGYLDAMEYLAIRSYMRYIHVVGQLHYTFNHFVPVLVVVSLLLAMRMPLRYGMVLVSLVFCCSPFGSLAAFVALIIKSLCEKQGLRGLLLNWNLVPCLFLMSVMCCYLLGQSVNDDALSTAASVIPLWGESLYWQQLPGAFENTWVRLFRYAYISVILVFQVCIVVSRRLRNNSLFYALIVLIFGLPLIWIGRIHNEFLYKGSSVIFIIYAWLVTIQWKHSSLARRIVTVAVVVLSSFHLVKEVSSRRLWTYSWSTESCRRHVVSDWNGHLNHPAHYAYQNFWGKNILPSVFYDVPGESMLFLPHAEEACSH